MAGLRAAMEPLRKRLSHPRSTRDAAGPLGSFDRLDGFRGFPSPGMAHDDLPAVLRRRRDLLRVRHGSHAHGDLPQGVPPRAHHHHPALRLHGEDHARHRVDGRLRLCHGVLHRLVQREPLRVLHVPQPRGRTVRLGLLDHGLLQRAQPAGFLVQEGTHERHDPVRHVDHHQHRHVVRAVRDHHDVAAPRLPPLVLGALHSHDLGRVDPARELRALLHDVLPVRALRSDGGNLRGEDRTAAGRSAWPVRPRTREQGTPRQGARRWRTRSRGSLLMALLLPQLPKGPNYGILAEFATPTQLYHACERVRDAGFTRWDAHTPFPVHGLEKAMGLRRSPLPWIVLGMGLTGAALGFVLQWWVHASAQPLVISGKPYFAWPAMIPVTFELGVLFAALGAVFGMLALNRLPMHNHPLFRSKVFERVTDDAFFISIESWDPRFDPSATGKLLESLGARSVELVESE